MSNISSLQLRHSADRIAENLLFLKDIFFGRLSMPQKIFNDPLRTRAFELNGSLSPPANTRKSVYEPEVFEGAQNIVSAWLQKQFGDDLLPLLQEGKSFDHEEGDTRLEVVADKDHWAFRGYYNDTHGTRHITEVLLEKSPQGKISIVVAQDAIKKSPNDNLPPPYPLDFLSRLATEYTLSDGGRRLVPHVQRVMIKKEVDTLVSFLRSSNRRQPVILFAPFVVSAQQRGSASEQETYTDYVMPIARNLAERAGGLAHIAVVANEQDVVLGQELGEDYAIRPGEIRIYPPHEKPDQAYTMWTAVRGLSGNSKRERWSVFEKQIMRRLASSSQQKRSHRQKPYSPFLAAQNKIAPPEDKEAIKALAAEEAFNLLVDISQRFDEIESAKSLGAELDNTATALTLKNDIELLRSLRTGDTAGALADILDDTIVRGNKMRAGFMAAAYGITKPYIEKYDAMIAWVDEYFSKQLVLSEEAKSALKNPKKAKYHDVNLIYAAVEVLATDYYNMKVSEGMTHEFHKQRFQDRLSRLRLEDSMSLTPISRERFKEEYEVKIEGQSIDLDRHLKRGNSANPTESARIYYGWDPIRQRVIIGSLAGHKRNALTN